MKKYHSKTVVMAGQIESITYAPDKDIVLVRGVDEPYTLDKHAIVADEAEVDDYLVVHADGDLSWLRKDDFEAAYTETIDNANGLAISDMESVREICKDAYLESARHPISGPVSALWRDISIAADKINAITEHIKRAKQDEVNRIKQATRGIHIDGSAIGDDVGGNQAESA